MTSLYRWSLLLLIMTSSSLAKAADPVQLPFINLGATSFMDGNLHPSTAFQFNYQHNTGDRFKNGSGKSLPGSNEIEANAAILQYVVITEDKWAGAYWGWEFLLPIADVEPDTDIGLNQGETGIGDLIFSPLILQWRDHTLFGKPYHHRANALFWLPTGSYSSNRQVNIGANTWRFNPYYAGTLILSPEWEVSFRLMYLWSTKNTSPNPFIASNSIQPGTAFHMNYSVSYEIKHGLRAGLAGYYLNQTRRDRVDNMSVVDSGEKIYALGPGFIWKNKAGITTFNAYGEFGAENRPEGFSVVARHAWIW